MTLKQAAQSAIGCQNACNASGLLKTLAGPVMDALWAAHEAQGTRSVNRSPIIALYLFKIGELNGYGISSLMHGYDDAMGDVKQILETPEVSSA